jgi:hypothetical protein
MNYESTRQQKPIQKETRNNIEIVRQKNSLKGRRSQAKSLQTFPENSEFCNTLSFKFELPIWTHWNSIF